MPLYWITINKIPPYFPVFNFEQKYFYRMEHLLAIILLKLKIDFTTDDGGKLIFLSNKFRFLIKLYKLLQFLQTIKFW